MVGSFPSKNGCIIKKKKKYNKGIGRLAKPKKPLGFALEVQEDSDASFELDAVIKPKTVTPLTLGLLPNLFQLNA